MRFINYALWNPFALLNSARPETADNADQTSDYPTTKEEVEMVDISEFEIPSAILASALIEKSDLKGADLESYAFNIQRKLIRQMMASREKMETEER